MFSCCCCCCFWCVCSYFHLLRLRLVGCASNIFPSLWLKSSTLIFQMHTFSSALHIPHEMRRDMNCWIFIRHFRCAYNNVLCNHSSALHGVYVCDVCIECIGIQIIIDPVLSARRKYQAQARTTAQRTFIRFAHSIPHANKTLARTLHYERYA